ESVSGGTRGPFPWGCLLERIPFLGVPPARTRPDGAAPRTGSSCHYVVGGPAFEVGRDRSVGTIAEQRVPRAGPVPRFPRGAIAVSSRDLARSLKRLTRETNGSGRCHYDL